MEGLLRSTLSCDSLSSMNQSPKWLVTTLSFSCQFGIFWGKMLSDGINIGYLSLRFMKDGGGNDNLHRCLWFSNGNLEPKHTRSVLRAGCGTRSPLISSLALEPSINSFLVNTTLPLW